MPSQFDIVPPASDSLSEGVISVGNNLPRYHKRAFAHNYHAPFIYHIILKKKETAPHFGSIRGDARIKPGNKGCAYIEESALGHIIAKHIFALQFQFPVLQIYQYMVMPDHVHILINVKDWSEYHLDYYIDKLCANIAAAYSRIVGNDISYIELFQPGYCDKPLLLGRNLNDLFRYIRENPHRLAMRMQFPQFFQRVRKLRIGESDYEAYGNLFLFRNPDKEAVKISRAFSEQEKTKKRIEWLTAAAQGTILVSPFISQAEKSIRSEAETLNAKLILVTHLAFPERYKPTAHDFKLCAEGRLLIISLGLSDKNALTRRTCLALNDLAQTIARSPRL